MIIVTILFLLVFLFAPQVMRLVQLIVLPHVNKPISTTNPYLPPMSVDEELKYDPRTALSHFRPKTRQEQAELIRMFRNVVAFIGLEDMSHVVDSQKCYDRAMDAVSALHKDLKSVRKSILNHRIKARKFAELADEEAQIRRKYKDRSKRTIRRKIEELSIPSSEYLDEDFRFDMFEELPRYSYHGERKHAARIRTLERLRLEPIRSTLRKPSNEWTDEEIAEIEKLDIDWAYKDNSDKARNVGEPGLDRIVAELARIMYFRERLAAKRRSWRGTPIIIPTTN